MIKGTLSVIDLPTINRGQFEQDTKQVAADDGFGAKPIGGSFPRSSTWST